MLRVGMEIHARVASQTKLFSRASTAYVAGASPPNMPKHVALFDAGIPGSLPRLNRACVEKAVLTGLALRGTINERSVFERKHYFYGDSPLGFQITQQRAPLVVGGSLDGVPIARIQLEQDTAQSQHLPGGFATLIDLNRAGGALMEIVTEPTMRSPEEAVEFLKSLQALLRCVGSCDGNMELGSMRADVNVSVDGDVHGQRIEVEESE